MKTPAEIAAEKIELLYREVCNGEREAFESINEEVAYLSSIINEAFAETLERLKIAEGLLDGPTQKRHNYNEQSALWTAGYWTAFKDIRGEYESRINPQKAAKVSEKNNAKSN